MAQGNLDEAKAWFDAADQFGESEGAALLNYNFGIYWVLKGDLKSARLRLNRAADLNMNDRRRVGSLLVLEKDAGGSLATKEVFERPVLYDAINSAIEILKDFDTGSHSL